MAICPHCQQKKPDSSFYRNAGRKNGLSILCKTCYRTYEASPERRAKRTWNTLHTRVRLQPAYRGVEVRMTRSEFLLWAVPAYERWMREYPGDTPSLDRERPEGHYELGNLRIIARGENARLARNHPNVHAPAGMAWCHQCSQYLPTLSFQKCRSAFNGLQRRCRECQNRATSRSVRGTKSRRDRRPASQV
jgi:hypothetical protein